MGNQRVSLSNSACEDEYNFVIAFPMEFQLLWSAGMGVTPAPHMDLQENKLKIISQCFKNLQKDQELEDIGHVCYWFIRCIKGQQGFQYKNTKKLPVLCGDNLYLWIIL